jgi:hypothetical protein
MIVMLAQTAGRLACMTVRRRHAAMIVMLAQTAGRWPA